MTNLELVKAIKNINSISHLKSLNELINVRIKSLEDKNVNLNPRGGEKITGFNAKILSMKDTFDNLIVSRDLEIYKSIFVELFKFIYMQRENLNMYIETTNTDDIFYVYETDWIKKGSFEIFLKEYDRLYNLILQSANKIEDEETRDNFIETVTTLNSMHNKFKYTTGNIRAVLAKIFYNIIYQISTRNF